MREVLKGWKTNITAVLLGGKLLFENEFGVITEQVGALGDNVINLVGVGLILLFRYMGKRREQANEWAADELKKLRSKYE
jgi:hypothetical protein